MKTSASWRSLSSSTNASSEVSSRASSTADGDPGTLSVEGRAFSFEDLRDELLRDGLEPLLRDGHQLGVVLQQPTVARHLVAVELFGREHRVREHAEVLDEVVVRTAAAELLDASRPVRPACAPRTASALPGK